MNKQQTLSLLKQQMPSFYSLDQVIEIVSKIDEAPVLNDVVINTIIEAVAESVKETVIDIDFEDYDCEFDIQYGNEIVLKSIDVQYTDIVNPVKENLRDVLNDLAVELEKKAAVAENNG